MKTIKLLQEKLDLTREEICELIGVDPDLQKNKVTKIIIFSI